MNIYSKVLKKPITKKNYFNTKHWIFKERALINKKLKLKERNINYDNVLFYYLSFNKAKKFNILDWGGGFGNLYFELQNIKKEINILVYEPEKIIVDQSKKIFKGLKNISFTNNKTFALKKKINLLYLGSVIQYIFDIDNFLDDIKKINCKEIVIYDLLASKNPNFYAYQNFFGEQMLVKFYNLNYLIKKFKKIGYVLIFKSNLQRRLLNIVQSPPMSNFPKKFRIDYSKQVIFRKKNK